MDKKLLTNCRKTSIKNIQSNKTKRTIPYSISRPHSTSPKKKITCYNNPKLGCSLYNFHLSTYAAGQAELHFHEHQQTMFSWIKRWLLLSHRAFSVKIITTRTSLPANKERGEKKYLHKLHLLQQDANTLLAAVREKQKWFHGYQFEQKWRNLMTS